MKACALSTPSNPELVLFVTGHVHQLLHCIPHVGSRFNGKRLSPRSHYSPSPSPSSLHRASIVLLKVKMGTQPNRLQLNFGLTDNRQQAYPTTPSTFPQPFPNSNGQQEVWGTQQTNTGYGNAGYFMNNPYQAAGFAQQANNLPTTGGASSFRSPAAYNDGTNGLIHQFSHQNLGGGTPRSGSPYGRQPSPASQRPRTAGAPSNQSQYGNFLSPQVPVPNAQSLNDEEPPAKNPDRYGENVSKKAKVCTGLVSTFFKDNVQRARDRNGR